MAISTQIKAAIRASGKSLNEIALAAGVQPSVLWRFMEDGDSHRDIRLEKTADKLAAYFGLTLSSGDQPKQPKKKK